MATRYAVLFDRDAAADLASIRDYIAAERGREFAEEFSLRVVPIARASVDFRTGVRGMTESEGAYGR